MRIEPRPISGRFARLRLPKPSTETLLMFGVALALRAAYTWLAQGPDAFPNSDSADYDAIAWNLAQGLGFKLTGAAGLYSTAFRPPALPFVTSLVYRLTGHVFLAALLMQCVIGALVPVALVAFARSTFGSSAARIAGWLAVVHPMLVFFSGYLVTEPLFALSLVLALSASAAWVKTPRPGRAVWAGMLWGASILTRPNAMAMPFLVLAWAWAPLGLSLRGSHRLRQAAALMLGVVLVVGPWTLRNARELHAFVPVTTGGGRSLLDSNNALIWDDPATRGGAVTVYHLEPYASHFRGLNDVEADRLSGRMAVQFLLERRAQWPQMALAKLARFWRLTSEGGKLTKQWKRTGTPLDALMSLLDPLTAWSVVVLPLALWGLAVTLRGPRRAFQSLPALVIAFFSLSAIVYWGSLRMRVPIEPLVALLAAVGADAILKARRVRRSGLALVD